MSYAERVLAQIKTEARVGWDRAAADFYGISAMMSGLVFKEYLSAKEAGELPKSTAGLSTRVRKAAWDEIERTIFKGDWDNLAEFNKKLDRDEVMKSQQKHGNYPYFTTDKWIKDVGPVGTKIKKIVEKTYWDQL